jgi:hypothetical protein
MEYFEKTEKTYLPPQPIDDFRENLFVILELKFYVGLVFFPIKNRLVKIWNYISTPSHTN